MLIARLVGAIVHFITRPSGSLARASDQRADSILEAITYLILRTVSANSGQSFFMSRKTAKRLTTYENRNIKRLYRSRIRGVQR